MKTVQLLKLCVLMALGTPAAFAADGPATVEPSPATRPAAADINALITRLGAEDFKIREGASEELRKLGQAAIPSLTEAARSFDPEVQSRAKSIVKDIENAAKPKVVHNDMPDFGDGGFGAANGQIRIMINGRAVNAANGGNFRMSKTVTVSNNRKEIEVTENQQTVRISEGADGIKMSVTDTSDGKATTTKYEAKNAAELKEKQPDAYKIYEKNTKQEPAGRLRAGRGIRSGIHVVPQPADADDIRIELPPEMLRELPPEVQRQFAPRADKNADKPATRPAKEE